MIKSIPTPLSAYIRPKIKYWGISLSPNGHLQAILEHKGVGAKYYYLKDPFSIDEAITQREAHEFDKLLGKEGSPDIYIQSIPLTEWKKIKDALMAASRLPFEEKVNIRRYCCHCKNPRPPQPG